MSKKSKYRTEVNCLGVNIYRGEARWGHEFGDHIFRRDRRARLVGAVADQEADFLVIQYLDDSSHDVLLMDDARLEPRGIVKGPDLPLEPERNGVQPEGTVGSLARAHLAIINAENDAPGVLADPEGDRSRIAEELGRMFAEFKTYAHRSSAG